MVTSLILLAIAFTAEPAEVPSQRPPAPPGQTWRPDDTMPEPLRNVHRIVFLGDSITQAGDYVTDVDCWLASRGINIEVLNLGLASETASDLTEAENEGHKKAFGFARPSVSERLDRVLEETQPDLLFACYGMNDGGSLPADDTGVARFTAAITTLRVAALKAGVRRVVICTPPVHDSRGDQALKVPDENLTRYSEWLLTKKADGWEVVDIHGPMLRALDQGRAKDPAFVFAADRVHPGREGHWLMAQSILQQFFHADLKGVSSAELLFKTSGGEIRNLVGQRMRVLFGAWMTRIGHKRPGVPGGPGATQELSIREATAKAAEMTRQIASLNMPVDGPDAFGAYAPSKDYTPPKDPAVLRKLQEWQGLKFGILLDWQACTQWGIDSWPLCPERYDWNTRKDWVRNSPEGAEQDNAKYKANYEALKKTFRPVKFDPDRWAGMLKDAGVKYALIMAKHHDGFCLWDTARTDYKTTSRDCPFHELPGADTVKSIGDALRRQGIRVGIYFSKPDWNSPYFWDPALPFAKDRNANYNPLQRPETWKKFKDFTWAQIEELMSNYGPIDILWLDGGWVRPDTHAQAIDMEGIAAMARKHQPGLLVVDRTVQGPHENYITPEGVHAMPASHQPYPWEACMPIGEHWNYFPNDTCKRTGTLVRYLCRCAGRGGNYLLGIGPDASGAFEPAVIERMAAVGAWLKLNGEAIYDTRPIKPYEQAGCVFTAKRDGTAYAILLAKDDAEKLPATVSLPATLVARARSVSLLGFGRVETGETKGGMSTIAIPDAARKSPPCKHAWSFRLAR